MCDLSHMGSVAIMVERIKCFIRDNGLSIRRIAESIGMNESTLYMKLNGERTMFPNEIEKIKIAVSDTAAALGVFPEGEKNGKERGG